MSIHNKFHIIDSDTMFTLTLTYIDTYTSYGVNMIKEEIEYEITIVTTPSLNPSNKVY